MAGVKFGASLYALNANATCGIAYSVGQCYDRIYNYTPPVLPVATTPSTTTMATTTEFVEPRCLASVGTRFAVMFLSNGDNEVALELLIEEPDEDVGEVNFTVSAPNDPLGYIEYFTIQPSQVRFSYLGLRSCNKTFSCAIISCEFSFKSDFFL